MTVFILMIVHYIYSQICDAFVGSGPSSKPLLPYHRLPWRSHQELVVDADTVMEQSEIEKMNLLIERRAAARWIGDFEVADALRREIATHKFFANIEVVIQDFPRTEGGGSKWKLVCSLENSVDGSLLLEQGVSVLTLAHTALGMAVSKAESQISVNFENELISLVRAAKQQLRHWSEIQRSMERVQPAILPGPSSSMKPNASTSKAWLDSLISNKRPRQSVLDWTSVERNLAGRKAADAAFWFALAGSTDEELFTLLTEVCTKEVEKWGVSVRKIRILFLFMLALTSRPAPSILQAKGSSSHWDSIGRGRCEKGQQVSGGNANCASEKGRRKYRKYDRADALAPF
jgi:hypothetical protein